MAGHWCDTIQILVAKAVYKYVRIGTLIILPVVAVQYLVYYIRGDKYYSILIDDTK